MWWWLLWIAVGVVGLLVLGTLLGLLCPRGHVAIVAAEFRAPAERLFDAIADHASHPTWRSSLKAVERGPDVGGRPQWIERRAGGDRLPVVDEVVERPSRLVGRIVDAGMPFGGTWTFTLTPAGARTRVTIAEDGFVKVPLFRLLSRLCSMTGTAERYLRDLGRHVGEDVAPVVERAR